MRSCTLLLTAAMLAFAAPVLAEENPASVAQPAGGTPTAPTDQQADSVGTPPSAAESAAEPPVVPDTGVDLLAIDITPPDPIETPPASGTGLDPLAMPLDDPMAAMEGVEPEPAHASATKSLGPTAVDEHGHEGRIHTVVKRDTLWDISTAYLGTPWVWPSIWQDNGEITDPNLIVPGDRIWISAGEMRKVTHDQAEAMIAADTLETGVPEPPAGIADDAGSTEQAWEAPEDTLMAPEEVATTTLPVAVPLDAGSAHETGLTIRIMDREAMGFITAREMDAATSLLDSESSRTWLAEGDLVDLGIGDGQVEIGDEYTIFRDATPVRDLDGGRLLGYHVDILGWMVVRKITGESATAEVRMSNSEMHRGDLAIPRVILPVEVAIKTSPEGIDGQIVFMPDSRTTMGGGDHVYLNRGSLHGFEVGSHVEAFTPGRLTKDRATGARVMTPDRIDAQMVLVEVKPDTSVAYVVRAARELELGDRVRAAARVVASR